VRINEFGQPVGEPVSGWTPCPLPCAEVLEGRYCRLERLDPGRHTQQLFDADRLDGAGESWTYLPYGPFTDLDDYRQWVEEMCKDSGLLCYAVIGTDPVVTPVPAAVGVVSLLRMEPAMGAIEVGHVHYSPRLSRTRAATEAQYLLASHVFDELAYRRYEWKCDALNAASRSSAQRLGFVYEGTFRQHRVTKGRSRDSAWYAMIDSDWPVVKDRFTRWLEPGNFDPRGNQLTSLTPVRADGTRDSP
jgi:RimJ/RimL family protein N-acetyltransferase